MWHQKFGAGGRSASDIADCAAKDRVQKEREERERERREGREKGREERGKQRSPSLRSVLSLSLFPIKKKKAKAEGGRKKRCGLKRAEEGP